MPAPFGGDWPPVPEAMSATATRTLNEVAGTRANLMNLTSLRLGPRGRRAERGGGRDWGELLQMVSCARLRRTPGYSFLRGLLARGSIGTLPGRSKRMSGRGKACLVGG